MTYTKIWEQAKRRTGATNITDTVGLEYVNFALDNYSLIYMDTDGRWKFDDSRNTDHPKGYAAVVSGQHDYQLDSTFLHVDQVNIKYDGTWRTLDALDRTGTTGKPLDQEYNTAGIPKYFDYDGQSIWLYPAPNWSDSGDLTDTANLSLRVDHTRPAEYVTTLATTLGIPQTHRGYLLADICYQIATATNDPSMTVFEREMEKQERRVRNDFTMRDEASPRRMKPKVDTAFNRN